RAMGIPLRAGRVFAETDSPDSAKVMVINETLARRFWPNDDPIGKLVTMKDWGPPLTGEIVGITGDVKPEAIDSDPLPTIYWPYTQFPIIFDTIVIRSDGNPHSLVSAVKSQIWSVDPLQAIANVNTMEHVLANSVATRRFNTILISLFAATALALASIGIY